MAHENVEFEGRELRSSYLNKIESSFHEVIDEIDLHLESVNCSELDDFDQLFNDFGDLRLPE